MTYSAETAQDDFSSHVNAIIASGVLGRNSKLGVLFDFLVKQWGQNPPTEQILAREVFSKDAPLSSDDSTVRVYVHRLRQKLELFYLSEGKNLSGQLSIPKGTYALVFVKEGGEGDSPELKPLALLANVRYSHVIPWGISVILIVVLLILSVSTVREKEPEAYQPVNSLWRDFMNDSRPVVILLGDYYMVGEFSQTGSGEYLQRYVRDFRVNNPEDLEIWANRLPTQFFNIQDISMSYLPLSVGGALGKVLPEIVASGKPFKIQNVSEAKADVLRENNVIYIGLVSGMSFIEPLTFSEVTLLPGVDYDEIIDTRTDITYRTDEPTGRRERAMYTDYAVISYQASGNRKILAIAGLRDTGLIGAAEVVTSAQTNEFDTHRYAHGAAEYLFKIPGLNGAPINRAEMVVSAKVRRD